MSFLSHAGNMLVDFAYIFPVVVRRRMKIKRKTKRREKKKEKNRDK